MTLVGGVLLPVEKQSVYSTAPADWATRHLLGESCPLQRSSRCILQPQPTEPQDTCWGSLALCREAVGVFYSPSRLSHRTLVWGVLPSAEKQSVYSTAPADWATGHLLGESCPLQRSIRCILQPQPTGQCSFGFYQQLIIHLLL